MKLICSFVNFFNFLRSLQLLNQALSRTKKKRIYERKSKVQFHYKAQLKLKYTVFQTEGNRKKTRPKNSIIKPLSSLSESYMKIQGCRGWSPLPPAADTHDWRIEPTKLYPQPRGLPSRSTDVYKVQPTTVRNNRNLEKPHSKKHCMTYTVEPTEQYLQPHEESPFHLPYPEPYEVEESPCLEGLTYRIITMQYPAIGNLENPCTQDRTSSLLWTIKLQGCSQVVGLGGPGTPIEYYFALLRTNN